MKDMVPLGTGNSRTLKSGIDSNMTWEQFRAALVAGTLPIDLGAVNPAGVAQVGDPLNKANLLPDDVAAALGLTGNPQPKDALGKLGAKSISKDKYYWQKYKRNFTVTERSVTSRKIGNSNITVYYSSNYEFVNGVLELISPQSATFTHSQINGSTILNDKYFYTGTDTTIYRGNSAAVTISGYDIYKACAPLTISFVDEHTELLDSFDEFTYPHNAVVGEYYYVYQGRTSAGAKIVHGSYIGTGTYGASNPNSYALQNDAKLVVISADYTSAIIPLGYLLGRYDKTYARVSFAQSGNSLFSSEFYVKLDGNTLFWYYSGSQEQATRQLNALGTTYYVTEICGGG